MAPLSPPCHQVSGPEAEESVPDFAPSPEQRARQFAGFCLRQTGERARLRKIGEEIIGVGQDIGASRGALAGEMVAAAILRPPARSTRAASVWAGRLALRNHSAALFQRIGAIGEEPVRVHRLVDREVRKADQHGSGRFDDGGVGAGAQAIDAHQRIAYASLRQRAPQRFAMRIIARWGLPSPYARQGSPPCWRC